jgi:chromosomal replication initiator protein
MTNKEIWEAALGEIELSISPASFTTWFKNTFILSIEDGRVLISVPNGFAKEWLENKYNLNISKALRNFIEDIKEIRCVVSLSDATGAKSDTALTAIRPLKDSLEPQRKPSHSILSQASSGAEDGQINLSLRYTFENFIVGANNELARAACEAVAKNLGQAYNPLFIYGGVGLGKTHLLQSIGNYILAKDPSRKILYSTSEYFTNRFIDMVKNQQAREFKQSYLDADLLIIDDIQFIAGKEKTQEEFFHIFNTLYQLNKQVVLSSDRPPKSIATLEERLRSRFEGGMIADISRPDLETRIAILRHKAAEKGFEADDDVFSYIANNIQHNIRELEGALNRVIVSCQLKQVDPSLANTKKILSDIISSGKKRGISFKQIAQAVADFYDINTQELINRSRRKDIVKPRQVAMYLMRSELKASYPGIGEQLGGRDHTTAMHAYEKISRELEQDEQLEQELNVIKNKIYNAG